MTTIRSAVASVAIATLVILTAIPAGGTTADPDEGPGIISLTCLVRPGGCVAGALIGGAVDIAGGAIDGVFDEIGELAAGAFTGIVALFGRAAITMLEVVTTWWITNPSLINSRGGLVASIGTYFYALTAFMVLAGFIWNGIQIIIQQRAEPAADLLRATLTYMIVGGGGIGLVQAAAAATDAWAAELIDGAFDQENLPEVFGGLLLSNTVLFMLFSLVLLIAGIFQALLLVMREISLVILTGMIMFAASGQYFRFSRGWLGNLAGMIIPILLWKPIAAMLIAISLSFISGATGVGDLIIGLVLFAGSAVAYKPLHRLFVVFTPGGGTTSGSGGGAVSALGTGAMGVAMLQGGAGGGAAASGAATTSAGAAAGPTGVAAGAAIAVTQHVAQQASQQGSS